jgi:hypothetical protein
MIPRNRSARTLAAVGAVAAASATAMIALVSGTASADEPGRCLENVNVREDPQSDAQIVAVCQAGTQVKLGESRNGFVHLTDLNGWAVQQYVKADDASSATRSDGDEEEGDRADQEERAAREAAARRADHDEDSAPGGGSRSGSDQSGDDGPPAQPPGLLGGLL